MHQIIARHKGEVIGINVEKPNDFKLIALVDANEDFITLKRANGTLLHCSTRYIIFASEGEFPLAAGAFKKRSVKLLVHVYHSSGSNAGGFVAVGIDF